ncbi:hypothetical protein Hanom_Chr01g00001541 [Helianthus anomalus]
MYISKYFFTKTTYITLLSEKFEGSGAPARPFYTSPLHIRKTTFYSIMKGIVRHMHL